MSRTEFIRKTHIVLEVQPEEAGFLGRLTLEVLGAQKDLDVFEKAVRKAMKELGEKG